MCQNCLVKTIHSVHSHFGWDNSFTPVERVAPGTTLEFECHDSSNGHFTKDSVVADVTSMPFDRINPVSGPVFVEGAMPGDVLKVTIDSFKPSGFGWTANIPGFGLLADAFPDPALHVWSYDTGLAKPAAFVPEGAVALKPFVGTVGLALAEPGSHSVVPPRRVGGNLDIRDNCKGTTLYLPVEVAGGLLSLGDTHAAQGDGEICGTAIESPMTVQVKLDLLKGENLPFPRLETSGPVTDHIDRKGYRVTTGVGPDLMQASRDAVSGMIDWLCANTQMAAVDAYMLCSVAGDLRISEIVDMPNWVVSFYFPKSVLG